MKRSLAILVLLVLSTVSAAGAGQRGVGVTLKVGARAIPLYSESRALILGASRYTNGWSSLPGVTRDVAEVRAALQAQGFDVRIVENPARAAMENALRDFVADFGQTPEARLLIYFAGHGHTLTTADGRQLGYIVPVDAPLPRPEAIGRFKRAAVSMTDIETIALQIESKHVLFVFDSCFSGSIFEATRAVPDDISERTARPVRQFITAGTADQTVPDNSLFRAQFIEGIGGEADRNRDGYVTGSELGDFLQTKITNYSRRAQTPQYGKIFRAGLDKGDFVFAPGVPAALRAAGADDASVELALWDSIKEEKDPAFFQDYLERFPAGRFASVARLKVRAATAAPAQPVSAPAATPLLADAAGAEVRVGLVDVQKVLSTSALGKASFARLQKLQDSGGSTAEEIAAARDRELQDLEAKIKPVIEAMAAETSATLLFNKFESGLIYASDSLDVTDPLIERFDGRTARAGVPRQFIAVVDVQKVLATTAEGKRTAQEIRRVEALSKTEEAKQAARDAELDKLLKKVGAPLAQLADEAGFGLAFNKFESGLVYATDAVDVTDLLIRKLENPSYRAAAPATRRSRAAVIDVQKVLTQSTRGKAAYERLKRMQETALAKAKTMDEEIQRLWNLNEITEKKRILKQYAADADEEIGKARDAELQNLENTIKPVIDGIGKEMTLAVIFNKFESGLVYASDTVDITDVVIQRFNAR